MVRTLLRPKVYNILSSLGSVMIDNIRAILHVLLSNGRANLSEDAEFLRGVLCKVYKEMLDL